MADEKQILKPSVALKVVGETVAKGDNGGAGSKGAPPTPQKFRFVKNFGVGQEIRFADGSKFKFRLISRNTGGYQSNSFVDTDDEKLASNLREAAKNKAHGIVEVK